MRLFLILSLFVLPYAALSQTPLIDSLQKVAVSENKNEQTLKAYQALVNEYSRTNMSKAKGYAHEGALLSEEQQLWTLQSGFYTQLVSIHQNTGNTDSSIFYLQALKGLIKQNLGNDKGKIEGNYYSAAGLFYKRQGNYKAALPFLLQAVQAAKKYSTTESVAGQLLNIGNTYMNIGSFNHALRYHMEALKLFESVGNKKGQSFCYQGIAEDFVELEQYEKALHYVKKSLDLKKELGDKRGISNALSAMGRSYLGLKKYETAFAYMTQSLQLTKELQLKAEEAKNLMNIGLLLTEKKEMEPAMEYYSRGKQLAIEAKDSASVLYADLKMAALEKTQKAQAWAEKQLVQNLQTTKASGNKQEELLLYQTLSKLYAQDGKTDKSLQFTHKYYEAKDSLLSKEVQLEISRIEEQFKGEKREAEIALLKKDQQLFQAELKRQKDVQYAVIGFAVLLLLIALLVINRFKVLAKTKQLVEMEKMRNSIAKDLHDDIGSTLSSINIMSRVLLQQAQKGTTDISGLKKIKDHSAAIMESMSDIVWAINPHNDTGDKMLYRMKEFAAEMLDPLGIHYTFVEKGDIGAVKLDPQRRRDLFLIFKESINNAAKYSQCNNLEIVLSAHLNNLQLLVKDDGLGFDMQGVKKGNGLKNLNERSNAAGGSLTYQTEMGKGTSIQLEVPIT